MKPLHLILLVAIIFVTGPLPQLAAQQNRIWQFLPHQVATVNQRLITRNRLIDTMLKLKPLKKYQLMSDSELKDNSKLVLKSIINRLLLEEQFKQYGIKVEKGEIRQRLNAMIQHMTPFQKNLFARKLREKKQTIEQYITEAENDSDTVFDLKLRKFIKKRYPGKLKVSDDLCEEYYRIRQYAFKVPSGVVVRSIIISPDQFTPKSKDHSPLTVDHTITERANAKAKATASKIYEMLVHKKANFIELARKYGVPGSGELGTIFKNGSLGDAEALVFNLGSGQISPVIKLGTNYQIIQVESKIQAGYTPFLEVKGLIREELENKLISKFSAALVMQAKRTSKIIIYF